MVKLKSEENQSKQRIAAMNAVPAHGPSTRSSLLELKNSSCSYMIFWEPLPF